MVKMEEEQGKKRDYDHLLEGEKVEVTSNEDGFQNAWFSGVILRPPVSSSSSSSSSSHSNSKKRRASDVKSLVHYDNLATEKGEPLTELVEASFIRPLPPPDDPLQKLEPGDVVDAFDRDCWWTGVLSDVVRDRYYVEFSNPPGMLELERSQLRPHWDWVYGTWRRPGKQVMLMFVESDLWVLLRFLRGFRLPGIFSG